MKLGIGLAQEVNDHVGALPGGMRSLENEAGIFLVTFSREADVVKLNFICAKLRDIFGERDVVILHFGTGRIGPHQLAVFAPGLLAAFGLHRQLGMLAHHALVAEHGDARDGVHVFRVQEANVLGQVVNVDVMTGQQRMVEGDVHVAVGVLDVEHDCIAAGLAPAADNLNAVVAGGHEAGQIDGARFKFLGDRDGFFVDRATEDSRHNDFLACLQHVVRAIAVGVADGFGEFRRSEKRSLAEILMRNGGNAVAALRRIDCCAGRKCLRRRDLQGLYGAGQIGGNKSAILRVSGGEQTRLAGLSRGVTDQIDQKEGGDGRRHEWNRTSG